MAANATIVGLDIGRHSVKAVWATRSGGRPVVTRTDSLRLPLDQPDNTGVILPWIENVGIHACPCVLGVPGQQCVFQPFRMEPEDRRTAEQAAAIEVVKFNEMAPEPMSFGFAPFSLAPGEKRFLLAMARPSLLRSSLDFARQAGLNVIDLVPTPVALFNGLEQLEESPGEPCLYLNIGHTATDVAVGSKAGLVFARSFGGGGQLFTDALAKALDVSTAQAESRKLAQATVPADGAPDRQALRRPADLWLAEADACRSVFRNLFPGDETAPTRWVLTGGGALLPGLREYIAQRMGVETHLAGARPVRVPMESPELFATAAGLAFCGLGFARAPVSLLPQEVRDELTFRSQKPSWIAAGAVAALILAVSLVGGFRDIRRKAADMKVQRASLRRLQALVADIEHLEAKSEAIRKMTRPLFDRLEGAPLARSLLTLTAASLAEGDGLLMLSDAGYYFAPPGDAPAASSLPAPGMRGRRRHADEEDAKGGAGFRRVILEGYTARGDFSTVKDLIARLNASDLVASADLLGDDELAPSDRRHADPAPPDTTRFTIDLRIAAP